ncbi:rDNA dimethyladenosine transferase, putative [Theileria annulata]|uniref:rRNA adenine N(6)-methyltransferase n=1 Tax=Theileria annulata TaxID=5874 RepID=Q4UAL1_THEAN|nr:rDNA dimethyladenosine transferase, putative [Theileria annulata]CAI76140.1 rDNA dimethyladenosine transferase, putative [Theileria annulata]|eukprot:XP_952766.1 rDNA dimethyladenosine transferase, putative [Theileria annulata]
MIIFIIFIILLTFIESFNDSIDNKLKYHYTNIKQSNNNLNNNLDKELKNKFVENVNEELVNNLDRELKSIKYGENVDVYPLEIRKFNSKVPKLPPGEFKYPRNGAFIHLSTVVSYIPTIISSLSHSTLHTHRISSLSGGNFITDLNLMYKMCNSLQHYSEDSGDGSQVIELGCGIGSLTHILYKKYKNMTGTVLDFYNYIAIRPKGTSNYTAIHFKYLVSSLSRSTLCNHRISSLSRSTKRIEIDSRAVSQLSRTLPNLNIINQDVLQMDYKELSNRIGKKLWIIGNLPFYITSQILMCLLDYRKYIDRAVITAQWEVAERLVAPVGSKQYSILSVLTQMFTTPKILFKLSNNVFYPKPKVQSACIHLDFNTSISTKSNSIEGKGANSTAMECTSTNSTNTEDTSNINNIKETPFGVKEVPFGDGRGPDTVMEELKNVMLLREILRITFNQKRKKLKTSLANLLNKYNIKLPENVLELRPQNLSPSNFITLTNYIHKHINLGNSGNLGNSVNSQENTENCKSSENTANSGNSSNLYKNINLIKNNLIENFERIWRKNKHGPKILISDII